MARISGIDLPNNKKILEETKVDPDKRVSQLEEAEISRLQKSVEILMVEGDLRRNVQQNIRRLEEIGTYRGLRHRRNLPAHGQRTKSNARTKRGKRATVGAIKKEIAMKMEAAAKKDAAGGAK